jgi:hypothetical protein
MTRVWALLDTIGWQAADDPANVKLDFTEHRQALHEALNLMMDSLAVELREAELARDERDKHLEEHLAKLWSLALQTTDET